MGQKERFTSLYVEIKVNDFPIKVHNIHLTWPTGAERRITQFNQFMNQVNHLENNIICGDFNVIGVKPWNIVLMPFFNIKPKEIRINERKIFDTIFKEYNYTNPFSGETSWPWVPNKCQLDHILIPASQKVLCKQNITKTYGSDHYPQVIEIGTS